MVGVGAVGGLVVGVEAGHLGESIQNVAISKEQNSSFGLQVPPPHTEPHSDTWLALIGWGKINKNKDKKNNKKAFFIFKDNYLQDLRRFFCQGKLLLS